MKKYYITIEEVVAEDFVIEADDIHMALEMAEKQYHAGKLVLCPGNLIHREISADDKKGNRVDWYEF